MGYLVQMILDAFEKKREEKRASTAVLMAKIGIGLLASAFFIKTFKSSLAGAIAMIGLIAIAISFTTTKKLAGDWLDEQPNIFRVDQPILGN